MTDHQDEVVAFLSRPSTYGRPGAEVSRLDTHGSHVFLVGDRAYKLKRAVAYDYMDFSTPARRRTLCEAEVRLNRRTAPALYLGVVPVTRTAEGELGLGGDGLAVDWVVEMRRFDQSQLLDDLAREHRLDLALMAPLGDAVAALHEGAEVRRDQGGRDGLAWVIEGNAEAFLDVGRGVLSADRARAVSDASRHALERHGAMLETRRQDGFVRVCHGDLHLRNIVLLDGRPTLFDGVEFNDRISCVDVLYDLAFVLMDLWRRDLPEHANRLFNAYLERFAQYDALETLPLFLACRAAVRAKTGATAAGLARTDAPARTAELEEAARDYLERAATFLSPPPPRLVAVGGWSGTGKSTVARAVAHRVGPPPGAVVLRSDVIRKTLHGVTPTTGLGPEAYAPAASEAVYSELLRLASEVLRAGHGVVVDAVFADAARRRAVETLAREQGVAFTGLWLQAPLDVLESRVRARGADASDATAEVVRAQAVRDLGPITWTSVDAAGGISQVVTAAMAAL